MRDTDDFSRRWLRQKARSKAGSPYQAHSASRKTGPRGPTRMFFGLTSPWTSAMRRAAVRATARSSVGASVGMRCAPSPRDRARGGSRGRCASCRSAAAIAGVAGRRGMDRARCAAPTAPAKAGSTRPASSSRLPDAGASRDRGIPWRRAPRPGHGRESRGAAPATASPGDLQPADLVGVALDRHAPIGRDAQLVQRALDGEHPAGGTRRGRCPTRRRRPAASARASLAPQAPCGRSVSTIASAGPAHATPAASAQCSCPQP